MWIQRDFLTHITNRPKALPIKILQGPRQVGKTSLLDHLKEYELVLFDDLQVRTFARENPSLFLDQFSKPLILDEATLAPELFPELKKRVDIHRRNQMKSTGPTMPFPMDIWITGSNQTLLQKTVRESLAGRASYFKLNTLSIHEICSTLKDQATLRSYFMRGGWPELYTDPELSPVHYLNDFISTFIEKDIVATAGIEKRAAFSKVLQLSAGRVGQLLNFSDLAKVAGVDLTTVQSWISLLELNGIVRLIPSFHSNLNQRLIKAPKLFFEDLALNTRLQGWSEFEPIWMSPYFGSLIEGLAYSELSRFFSNHAMPLEIYFLRSKEKVEVDFLLQLPNQKMIAMEVKSTPVDFTEAQLRLLESLDLNIIDHWVLTPQASLGKFKNSRVISFWEIYENLIFHLNLAS